MAATISDSKIAVIQDVYAAFARHDLDTILAVLDDGVDWASEATSGSAPWYGSYRGKAEVSRFFQALGSRIEEFTPLSFMANNTDVADVIRWTISTRETGKRGHDEHSPLVALRRRQDRALPRSHDSECRRHSSSSSPRMS